MRAQVASLQFNVLVTTYEYIMRDRARLAKVLRAAHANARWPAAWQGCCATRSSANNQD